uniref:Complex I assembly factor TIMMDC1, mitochondrial n=1 Tax=Chelonoidis abingdonii TaxID=106734 RepID=A0A8C0GJW2_CHEAB
MLNLPVTLFLCASELQQYPEETLNIIKATFSAAVIGWMYGGLPAFHHAKTQYIEQSQAEIFQNRLDAVQSAHRAAIRGFIRYGWRWSWRIATFVAIFNTVSTGLSVYRNKTTFSHFAAAGGEITLFLYCVLITAGGVLMAMEKLAGESIQEKRLRERRLLHEQKLRLKPGTHQLGQHQVQVPLQDRGPNVQEETIQSVKESARHGMGEYHVPLHRQVESRYGPLSAL